MKLSVKGIAIACAILWGGSILVLESASMIWPPYGSAFLEAISSIYPGYETGKGIISIVTGTIYGVVDGAIDGAIFAWVYNYFSGNA